MRELKDLLSKLSPLPISTSSAQYVVPHGNVRLGSSRYEQLLHSIFIEKFPSNINVEQLQTKFASFGDAVDPYIPNQVARKSGMKCGFIKKGEKAILSTIGSCYALTW